MSDGDVVAALDDHATPLASTAPDSDRTDLCPIADRLDGADAVGLGEATHGTREFFRLKHRLVRLLVERLGFRTVAFEADVAAMVAADAYVRRGEGDPDSALSELCKWQWRTRELRALLSWLRAFNEGREPENRVRVRWLDLSDPSAPVAPLRDYLRAVDPPGAAVADGAADLAELVESKLPDDDAARRRRLDEAAAIAVDVTGRLGARRGEYIAATSEERWAFARHCCRVVEQTCEWHRVRHAQDGPHAEGMAERDRLMAENVRWCSERDPGEGVAVWAHNSHVQRGTFDDGQVWTDAVTMGERLDRAFDDDYRPLGFDFGRGSFRAVPGDVPGADQPRTVSDRDPLEESATARLDALASPCFVDLDAARADPALSAWFDRDRRIRRVGSVFDPATDPEVHYQRTNLPESFDGLFFVGESSQTRPLDAA
jgi:erythromycin esterase